MQPHKALQLDGRELRPDSPLLARLQASRSEAVRVRLLSVVAGSDNLVVPRVFAAHEEVVRIPETGVWVLLFSPHVFGLVADRLLGADAPARASTVGECAV